MSRIHNDVYKHNQVLERYLYQGNSTDILNGKSNYYPIKMTVFLYDTGFFNKLIFKNSIPYVKYSFGIYYNPVTVALQAIVSFELNKIDYAIHLTKNLIENAVYTSIGYALFYHFLFPPRATRIPWVSGMAQGLAISVMLRAFVSTKNSMFLEYAEQFANVMLSDIESGGALYVDSRGVWIEEYPAEFPPKHVLNGLIFSIIGLYELTLFNRKYSKILSKIILTIEKNISLYDLGFWSKYDIEHCADLKYHLLNTILIYLLSDIFKSERLAQVAKRWLNGYYIFGKTKKLLQSR